VTELATSSYRQFRLGMGVPVRVTLGRPPRWFFHEWEEVRLIAPTPSIFKVEDDDEFRALYVARLRDLGPERIEESLRELSDRHPGERLVLLCYEDVLKGEVCHRRMFAAWWRAVTGERVPELDPADFTGTPRLFT
jgi:hypothetical protein